MLVLSRKRGESIILSQDEIQVTVLEIRGDTVRLGIKAPESVPVHREEVWLRINAESLSAQGIDRKEKQTDEHPAEETISPTK